MEMGPRAVKSPSLMIFKMKGTFCLLALEKGHLLKLVTILCGDWLCAFPSFQMRVMHN